MICSLSQKIGHILVSRRLLGSLLGVYKLIKYELRLCNHKKFHYGQASAALVVTSQLPGTGAELPHLTYLYMIISDSQWIHNIRKRDTFYNNT